MPESYLLRYPTQIEAFRNRYAVFIRKNSDRILEWFLSLPLYQWVRMPFDARTAEAGIGCLCLLHIEGKINLCVDRTVSYCQRFANSEQEYEDFIQEHFKPSK
jgi:hypothetical protein